MIEKRATSEGGKVETGALKSGSLLFMDPPDHLRLRGLVARAFTPRRMEGLRATTEAIARELLDMVLACAAAGPVDLIEAFAYPLPIKVICSLLGVPESDQEAFTGWSRAVARLADPTILRSAEIDAVLSALVAVEADGDRITPQETACDAAADRGPRNHGEPDRQRHAGAAARARSTRPRAPSARAGARRRRRAAALRFTVPGHAARGERGSRTVRRQVKAGGELMLILGAANRDPAVFEEPARLDVTRDARRHVAFGGGMYHCVGAALARLEGVTAFLELLARCPGMKLAAQPVRRPNFTLRGLESLQVSL